MTAKNGSRKRVRNLEAYRRLRALMQRADAAGWTLGIPPDTDVVPDAVAIYLCDYESRQMILVLLKDGALEEAETVAKTARLTFEQICNALGSVMDDVLVQGKLTEETRAALTLSAAAYVRGTKTYEIAQQRQSQAHYLVIRYREQELLRPAALARGDKLLSPAELESFISHMAALDRQAHPEWFAKRAEVIPFRLRDGVIH